MRTIGITKATGATFRTAGKYMAEDFAVVPALQSKSVEPSTEAQTVTPDAGYCGLSSVEVGAAAGGGESIPSKDLLNSIAIAEDESVIYLACDGTADYDARVFGFNITTTSGNLTVERGHVEGDAFVADAEATTWVSGRSTGERFPAREGMWVYRVKPATESAAIRCIRSFDTWTEDGTGVVVNMPTVMSVLAVRTGRMDEASTGSYFYGIRKIQSIVLGDGALSVATNAANCFNFCYSLRSLTLPDKALSVCTNAQSCFSGCSALRSLTLPDKALSVCTNAQSCFSGCYALTSLKLPAGALAVCTNATGCFQNCSALRSLKLPDKALSVCTNAQSMFQGCSALPSLKLPAGALSVCTNAIRTFQRCDALTSLTLPDGALSVCTNMLACLSYCYGLMSLTLPDGVGAAIAATGNVAQLLESTTYLQNVTGGFAIPVSFSVSHCTRLTATALQNIIDSLPTVTSETLTLSAATYALLTDEMTATAKAKNWTVTK